MSIQNGAEIKMVQEIILPETVGALNVFYFTCAFDAEQAEGLLVDALEDWSDALYTTIDGNMSDAATMGLMQVYVYVPGSPPEWEKIGEGTPDVTFQDTLEMLPHGVAALIRAYTTRAKTIGRKYFPAFTENAQEDGSWVSGAIANLAACAIKWGTVAVIDANNNLLPGVFSSAVGGVHSLTDEFVVPTHPAYQRRRRPGVGS